MPSDYQALRDKTQIALELLDPNAACRLKVAVPIWSRSPRMNPLAGLLLPLVLLPAAPVPTDRKFDADAAAKAVAPFLDDATVAVVHLDLTRLDADALHKQFAALANLKPGELVELKKLVAESVKKLTNAGARDAFVVFSLADLPKAPPFVVLPLDKDADLKAILGLKDAFKALESGYEVEQIGPAVVAGTPPVIKRLNALKPVARPEVAKAFAASGGGFARVVFVASADTRKGVEEAVPALPKELGGGDIKTLTRGLQWAAVGVETKPKTRIQFVYQATDKAAAKTLHEQAGKAGKALTEFKPFRALFPDGDKLVEALTPRPDGDRLTAAVDEATLTKLLPQVALRTREAHVRIATTNNLHQLGLAMHNYHDATGTLPAVANFDKQNKPLLSWRVHILPYLGEDEAKLYKEFKLDEPWDSEHNKKLIAKMPKVFATPADAKLAADGKTTFLGPLHKDAIFTGGKKGLNLAGIPDGTSNTVLLVDAEESAAVIWTKPDDLKIDPKNPHKGISSRHGEQFLFLFADGSVHRVAKTVDKNTLWAIFTVAGGEVVNLP
jgi:hypothetical protein